MRRPAIFTIALLLTACGSADEEPLAPSTNDIPVPAPSKPTFAPAPAFELDEVDARDLVATLGSPWTGKPVLDRESSDEFTGGFSDLLIFGGGSATIYTLPNGQVWQLQLRTGVGDRCGSSKPLARSYPIAMKSIAPDQQNVIPPAIAKALASTSLDRLDLDGLRVIASGDCVRQLTFKAT